MPRGTPWEFALSADVQPPRIFASLPLRTYIACSQCTCILQNVPSVRLVWAWIFGCVSRAKYFLPPSFLLSTVMLIQRVGFYCMCVIFEGCALLSKRALDQSKSSWISESARGYHSSVSLLSSTILWRKKKAQSYSRTYMCFHRNSHVAREGKKNSLFQSNNYIQPVYLIF